MSNRPRLIINSDDFGLSESVNEAIAGSFDRGYISSTTMMANMPGFESAVQFVSHNANVKGRVGFHLNLTEGIALSEKIKRHARFCNAEGRLIYDRKSPIFFLGPAEKAAVYEEIKAQLDRLMQHGIFPTHLDSHHHVHTEFGILNVYRQVAREYGIHKIRLTKNIGRVHVATKIYKLLYNTYLRQFAKMRTTDIFCSASEFLDLIAKNNIQPGKTYEIMVHCKLNVQGEITDIDHELLDKKVWPITSISPLISYGEL